MSHSLRSRLALIALGLFVSFAPCGDSPPKNEPAQPGARVHEDVFDHPRFCVTIWPEQTQVVKGSSFEVKLRVVNSSQHVQSIRVWDCSWQKHWKVSNPRLDLMPAHCWDNARVTVQLQPGGAYEKVAILTLMEKGASKTESFRMGFTPDGEKTTYWSNEVVLGVQ